MADVAKKLKLAGAGVAVLVLVSLSFALLADYSSEAGVPVKFSKKRVIWAVLWRPVANVDQVRSRC